MKLSVNYLGDIHSLTFAVNHIGEYDDNPATRMIEEQTTYDLHYNVDLSGNDSSDGSALYLCRFIILPMKIRQWCVGFELRPLHA